MRPHLPIDPLLPVLLEKLERSTTLILKASPGSGKTTRVPPALLQSALLKPDQEIWVLVPRRLAAKTAAQRVAQELGEEVGRTVGYQFRFEKVIGPQTRLKFLTEGMLVRLLIRSPTLPEVGMVILDEFHERHLHTDVALSYLHSLQRDYRPDLRIVVMSATLDTETLSRYLGEAPTLSLDSPVHPLTIQHLLTSPTQKLELAVGQAVKQALSSKEKGDILVFLPGMSEIRRAEETLHKALGNQVLILPLHGDLPKETQGLIFEKADRTKVILSTNVAESSLTIEGVNTVIDSGLHRQASFSWWSGVPALRTRPIPKASAIQRAGRAGRTGPGQVFRLYSQSDLEGRPSFEAPEIRRADLTQTILELKALKIESLKNFSWFDPPSPASLQSSVDLLFSLDALDGKDIDAPLTEMGKKMAEISVHPRLARVLLEAEKKGVLEEAALLAALISEGELEELDALHALEAYSLRPNAERVRKHLLSYFQGSPSPSTGEGPLPAKAIVAGGEGGSDVHTALTRAILAGYPDRIAKKRAEISTKPSKTAPRSPEVDLVFSQGGSGSVRLTNVVADSEYFIVLDVEETQRFGQNQAKVQVRSLVPLEPEWLLDLSPSPLQESSELTWDKKLEKVVQHSKLSYGQLTLEESFGKPKDLKAAERLLLKEGLGLDLEKKTLEVPVLLKALLPLGDPEAIEEVLTRIQLASKYGSLDLPALEGEKLSSWVEEWFRGATAHGELRKANLPEKILSLLPFSSVQALNQILPSHLTLSRGRRTKIHYRWGQEPWIQSRLQDFFGMKETPRILKGSLPITLHLLAPSQRPVQVTKDLASFWKNTYPVLRKELGRKYPKHAWPENPY